MTDRELLEYIAAQVGSLNLKVDKIDDRLNNVEKIVTSIENDHGKKLEALLDGYKQNAEKIEKIEKEVTKQEEFIMKRVK